MVQRKALCIGVNLPGRIAGLSGACCDAVRIGKLLPSFGFPPENTRILYDGNPCSAKRNARNTDPDTTPSKDNLIFQLRWLVKDSFPGDVLFFFYSGFGLLVDDSCGYDGEGLEEAILPSDAESMPNEDLIVVLLSEVRDILNSVSPGVSVTCVMDCTHATGVVDVQSVPRAWRSSSGALEIFQPSSQVNTTKKHRDALANSSASNNNNNTNSNSNDWFSTLLGLGQATGLLPNSYLCGTIPMSYSTKKNLHYHHNKDVWFSDKSKTKHVKHKFWGSVDVGSSNAGTSSIQLENGVVKGGKYPYKPTMARSMPLCFAYSAAGMDQVSVECDCELPEGIELQEYDQGAFVRHAVVEGDGEGADGIGGSISQGIGNKNVGWDKGMTSGTSGETGGGGGKQTLRDKVRVGLNPPVEDDEGSGLGTIGGWLGGLVTPRGNDQQQGKFNGQNNPSRKRGPIVRQGVLAHCFLRALLRVKKNPKIIQNITHADLAGIIAMEMTEFRLRENLPDLDQQLFFTASSRMCDAEKMRVFYPVRREDLSLTVGMKMRWVDQLPGGPEGSPLQGSPETSPRAGEENEKKGVLAVSAGGESGGEPTGSGSKRGFERIDENGENANGDASVSPGDSGSDEDGNLSSASEVQVQTVRSVNMEKRNMDERTSSPVRPSPGQPNNPGSYGSYGYENDDDDENKSSDVIVSTFNPYMYQQQSQQQSSSATSAPPAPFFIDPTTAGGSSVSSKPNGTSNAGAPHLFYSSTGMGVMKKPPLPPGGISQPQPLSLGATGGSLGGTASVGSFSGNGAAVSTPSAGNGATSSFSGYSGTPSVTPRLGIPGLNTGNGILSGRSTPALPNMPNLSLAGIITPQQMTPQIGSMTPQIGSGVGTPHLGGTPQLGMGLSAPTLSMPRLTGVGAPLGTRHH